MASDFRTLVGADIEMIGALEILGADSPSLAALDDSAQVAKGIASRNGIIVQDKKYTKAKRLILPLPETTIAAGATASVQTQTQTPFKGKRVIIPSDIAGSVTIDDIKVGKDSQLVTGAGAANGPTVPGRAFSEVAVELINDFDTANAAITVSLVVRNISGGSLVFRGALFGIALS